MLARVLLMSTAATAARRAVVARRGPPSRRMGFPPLLSSPWPPLVTSISRPRTLITGSGGGVRQRMIGPCETRRRTTVAACSLEDPTRICRIISTSSGAEDDGAADPCPPASVDDHSRREEPRPSSTAAEKDELLNRIASDLLADVDRVLSLSDRAQGCERGGEFNHRRRHHRRGGPRRGEGQTLRRRMEREIRGAGGERSGLVQVGNRGRGRIHRRAGWRSRGDEAALAAEGDGDFSFDSGERAERQRERIDAGRVVDPPATAALASSLGDVLFATDANFEEKGGTRGISPPPDERLGHDSVGVHDIDEELDAIFGDRRRRQRLNKKEEEDSGEDPISGPGGEDSSLRPTNPDAHDVGGEEPRSVFSSSSPDSDDSNGLASLLDGTDCSGKGGPVASYSLGAVSSNDDARGRGRGGERRRVESVPFGEFNVESSKSVGEIGEGGSLLDALDAFDRRREKEGASSFLVGGGGSSSGSDYELAHETQPLAPSLSSSSAVTFSGLEAELDRILGGCGRLAPSPRSSLPHDGPTAGDKGGGAGREGFSLMDLLSENYKGDEKAGRGDDGDGDGDRAAGGSGEGGGNGGEDAGVSTFSSVDHSVGQFFDGTSARDEISGVGGGAAPSGSLLDLLNDLDNDDAGKESGGGGSSSGARGSVGGGGGGGAATSGSLLDLLDDLNNDDAGKESGGGGIGGVARGSHRTDDEQQSSFLSILEHGVDETDYCDDYHDYETRRSQLPTRSAEESPSLDEVIDRVLALHAAMDDGELLQYHHSGDGVAAQAGSAAAAELVQRREECRAASDEEDVRRRGGAPAVAEALLNGWSDREGPDRRAGWGGWSLSTSEANALLLHIVSFLPPTNENVDLLLRVYRRMQGTAENVGRRKKSLESAVAVTAGRPDAATYAIVVSSLDKWAGSPSAAALVCSEMLDREAVARLLPGSRGASSPSLLPDERLVGVAMQILWRRRSVGEAERLLGWALDSVGGSGKGGGDDGGAESVHAGFRRHANRWEEGGVGVRTRIFEFLLKMYKEENEQEKAISLAENCLQENGKSDPKGVNQCLLHLVKWPERDRFGRQVCFPFQVIVDSLESFAAGADGFQADYAVWRALARQAGRAARRDAPGQWDLVRRSCRNLMKVSDQTGHARRKSPDQAALKVGMDAAIALNDAQLAVDLLEWAVGEASSRNHESGGLCIGANRTSETNGSASSFPDKANMVVPDYGQEKIEHEGLAGALVHLQTASGSRDINYHDPLFSWETQKRTSPQSNAGVSAQAFLLAITLCLEQGELGLARSVLDGCLQSSMDRVPDAARSHLHTLVMIGYAKAGEVDTARHMLTRMQKEGPKPTANTYAALIHALAVKKRRLEATEILQDMISDSYSDGIKPGQSCFNACMLSAMQEKDWQGVLDISDKMESAGLLLDSTSFHGIILASSRLGTQQRVIETVRSGLEMKLPMSRRNFLLCARVLAPCVKENDSTEAISKSLRNLANGHQSIAGKARELHKAISAAEIMEMNPPPVDAREKQAEKWRSALERLLILGQDMDCN